MNKTFSLNTRRGNTKRLGGQTLIVLETPPALFFFATAVGIPGFVTLKLGARSTTGAFVRGQNPGSKVGLKLQRFLPGLSPQKCFGKRARVLTKDEKINCCPPRNVEKLWPVSNMIPGDTPRLLQQKVSFCQELVDTKRGTLNGVPRIVVIAKLPRVKPIARNWNGGEIVTGPEMLNYPNGKGPM